MSRDRFDKIIAIAVNPGAYEEEAIAALLKARQLAKENPSLAPRWPTTSESRLFCMVAHCRQSICNTRSHLS
jgi:hypothetical protein